MIHRNSTLTISPEFWQRKDVLALTAKIDAGSAPAKITSDHCAASKMLREIANDYVDLYHGDFTLIHDYQLWVQRGKNLTNNQLAAALNALVNDYKRLPLPATPVIEPAVQPYISPSIPFNPPVSTPTVPVIVNGTYTVVLDEAGNYRTLRIDVTPPKLNQPQGTQIASYLSGADNTSNYTGFAFLNGTQIRIWSKFHNDSALNRALSVLINADAETRIDYGAAYAMESGACWHCGRKLTRPVSIARGLGPDCAKKLGVE